MRGGVAERSKAAVLKTADPHGSVGSNPTPSASSAGGDALDAAQIRPQRRGNHHRAVRLLVVLEDGDQRAPDGEAGAVERVRESGLAALGAVADVGATRLEVLAVAARGDLAIRLLARQPDLEVVGLRRREADVAGGEADDAIGQLEDLQHALGVTGE